MGVDPIVISPLTSKAVSGAFVPIPTLPAASITNVLLVAFGSITNGVFVFVTSIIERFVDPSIFQSVAEYNLILSETYG